MHICISKFKNFFSSTFIIFYMEPPNKKQKLNNFEFAEKESEKESQKIKEKFKLAQHFGFVKN